MKDATLAVIKLQALYLMVKERKLVHFGHLGKMSVGEMSVGEMSIDEMSVGELANLSGYRTNNFLSILV